jgi:hypothetical protein
LEQDPGLGLYPLSVSGLQDHLEWGLLLALLIVAGVRQLTLDHLLIGRIMLPSVRNQGGES